MHKLFLATSALSALGVLLTASAIAADLRMPVKAPPAPPAPVYNWTGCYIGGGGGYGMFDQEHDSISQFGVAIGPNVDTSGRGWFGTVQGGCDIQFGSFVPFLSGSMLFGGFADGDWGNIKGTNEASNLNLFGEEKLDQSWAAGARLGWLPTDRFLVFVSGGYTNAHIQDINFAVFPSGVVVNTLPAHRLDGWFIGTGYEYQLGWFPGLTWKTEYRWADYGSRTDTIDGPPPPPPPRAPPPPVFASSNSHLFVQTLRTELIWRFNWGNWGAPAPVVSKY
jgi:outer membrane immunogenic protein